MNNTILVSNNLFFIQVILTGMYIIVDLNRERIKPDIYEVLLRLKNNDSRNNTINTKNNTLAIEAAPAAIPPKPKMAATIAIIKKLADQRNIELNFNGFKNCLIHV